MRYFEIDGKPCRALPFDDDLRKDDLRDDDLDDDDLNIDKE